MLISDISNTFFISNVLVLEDLFESTVNKIWKTISLYSDSSKRKRILQDLFK